MLDQEATEPGLSAWPHGPPDPKLVWHGSWTKTYLAWMKTYLPAWTSPVAI
jgi:hypothetical protein